MLTKKIKKGIKGVYPFHMPGHKRNPKFLKNYAPLDVTETEATDNLHSPTGAIKSALDSTTRVFGTKKTFYITGGSTTALHAAIKSVTRCGDRVILSRNCHKSVWSICEVLRLKTDYVCPKINSTLGVFGEVNSEKLEALLKEKSASAVVITSPTYEGIVSDISSIAEIVHKYNSILIVDSAHGAHLGFSEKLPESARALGADIVVESAHKTLPCLTGAAMLHICSERVSKTDIAEAVGTFMTSSPPYPLIYSLDDMTSLLENKADKLFSCYLKKLDRFYERCKALKHLFLFDGNGVFGFDKGKILIVTKNSNINGFELLNMLLKENICCEMAEPDLCLCMTSIADTKKGFDRLLRALKKIDKTLSFKESKTDFDYSLPTREIYHYEAKDLESVYIMLSESEGKTAAEYIFSYPPGCPIIAPGEIITGKLLSYIACLEKSGANVYSSSSSFPDQIKVIKK